jgi:hypothetical protein
MVERISLRFPVKGSGAVQCRPAGSRNPIRELTGAKGRPLDRILRSVEGADLAQEAPQDGETVLGSRRAPRSWSPACRSGL